LEPTNQKCRKPPTPQSPKNPYFYFYFFFFLKKKKKNYKKNYFLKQHTKNPIFSTPPLHREKSGKKYATPCAAAAPVWLAQNPGRPQK